MPRSLKKALGVLLTLSLLIVGMTASAHFLLNLNVRIFHIEHTNEGLRLYARMPMPYLVADKIGDPGEDGLPSPAPFTTNAVENGAVVHYLDASQFAADPLGLGLIAEDGTRIIVDGQNYKGVVERVVLHRVGDEARFATLSEAQAAMSARTSFANDLPSYVGDVIVDVELFYRIGFSPLRYSLSSTLDPKLPDQEMTANLILDYALEEPLVYRSRGLLTEPIEVSRSRVTAIVTFVWEGIRHILEGIDHVLFVICLVIGAHTLRDLLGRVTGFTVGHSVTLSLGFFGFVPSGAWFVPTVETGIAISIIYAAYLAVRGLNRENDSTRNVFLVTVLIGLLHGLGFSFVLQEILQVTSPNIWQSLLAFNVGVELGQIAIVLIIWPLLGQVSKLGAIYAKWSRIAVASACSVVATLWTVERSSSIYWAILS